VCTLEYNVEKQPTNTSTIIDSRVINNNNNKKKTKKKAQTCHPLLPQPTSNKYKNY
jgi:hypothetical protein